MTANDCGAIGGKCSKGPKGHHKCDLRHIRVGGAAHAAHSCRYCGEKFTT